jgi:hypothetical protein
MAGIRDESESNADRRAARLRKEIDKQHRWRVTTWAKAAQYINVRQNELAELGFDAHETFEPDFNDAAMVDAYASGDF